jgi:hypothetical protein
LDQYFEVNIMKTPTIYPLLLSTIALSAAATLYACGGGGGGGGGDTAAPAPTPAPPSAPKAWQGAKAVDTTLSGIGFNSAVAVDASGNAISVWQQFDGTRSNIVASRYSASTGLWADALPLEKSDEPASSPRIAMDAGGNAIAIWQQYDATRNNIYFNRYSVSSGWGSATLLETNDSGTAVEQQISMDAAGNAVAVWQQHDGTRFNIWARRYDASAGWGVPQPIDSNDGDATVPQVALDANGNATAVWRQLVGTHAGIWASRTNAGAWSKPDLIETDNLGFTFAPQVAVDAKGNAMVVWQQFDSVRYHIKSNRFVVGSGWSTTTPVENNTTSNAADPQIAMDANGNAVAVWLQAIDANQKVWANRYTQGVGWSKPEPLESDNGSIDTEPQVAMDKFGNATAVWTQTNTIRSGVWARTSSATSPSVWNTAVPIDEPTGGEAQSPQIAMNTDGVAMAVWRQVKDLRDAVWSNALR